MSATSVEIPEMVMDDFLPDVQDVMGELRHEQQTLESFVLDLIDQLDRIRQEMVDHETMLDLERQQVAQREQELAELLATHTSTASLQESVAAEAARLREELEQSRSVLAAAEVARAQADAQRTEVEQQHGNAARQLATTEQELHAVREELSLVQHHASEQTESLKAELAAVQKELAAAQTELLQVRQDTDEQLSDLRQQLEATRAESTELHQQLDTARAELADVPAPVCEASQETSSRSAARVEELEQEIQLLEEELEVTRRRGAELSETLAQQERNATVERSGWTTELRELRRIFESKSASIAIPDATFHTETAAEVVPRRAAAEAPPDPVIGSVLQQFAQLQREASVRRGLR